MTELFLATLALCGLIGIFCLYKMQSKTDLAKWFRERVEDIEGCTPITVAGLNGATKNELLTVIVECAWAWDPMTCLFSNSSEGTIDDQKRIWRAAYKRLAKEFGEINLNVLMDMERVDLRKALSSIGKAEDLLTTDCIVMKKRIGEIERQEKWYLGGIAICIGIGGLLGALAPILR